MGEPDKNPAVGGGAAAKTPSGKPGEPPDTTNTGSSDAKQRPSLLELAEKRAARRERGES